MLQPLFSYDKEVPVRNAADLVRRASLFLQKANHFFIKEGVAYHHFMLTFSKYYTDIKVRASSIKYTEKPTAVKVFPFVTITDRLAEAHALPSQRRQTER